MPGWESLRNLVKEEIRQRSQEGCDVAGFAGRWESGQTKGQLMDVYRDLCRLRTRADFPYVEPSHLEGIHVARLGRYMRWDINADDALLDRVHGAWLGRIAGCMLGKPVEGWSSEAIREYLVAVGEYPLANYIPPAPADMPEAVAQRPRGRSARGGWDHALADDDTNYTVMGLKIMEEKGPDFTTADVGEAWLRSLPYRHVCTAEKQAYVNLVNELPIEEVPMYLNPYREWIGAQIRADFWGYCAPGWPEKAAEFAYRDAALSHVKNGIYGEMMCAAMISAALATDDLNEIIEAGLSEIPAHCRLAETVHDCLRWRKDCATWEQAFAKMLETYYGSYSRVHTNNNLAIVLIALLFGWPGYEKTVCTCVMQGMDTDCNGATAGSIVGAALGACKLPDKWIAPLGGRLDAGVDGFMQPRIDDLAKRTMAQIERVLAGLANGARDC
jgi:ADP-ribosylglycohydrolase